MRALRDHGNGLAPDQEQRLSRAIYRLARILRRVTLTTEHLDELRGFEGEAASLYFDVFDLLITSPHIELRFRGRSRRPPRDPINALLSFLYTLLTHDCRSAAETVGLGPCGRLFASRPAGPAESRLGYDGRTASGNSRQACSVLGQPASVTTERLLGPRR